MKRQKIRMNTAAKLKVCDKLLGVSLVLILVSGIQLEATGGSESMGWIHIGLGLILTALSVWHIYLHYRFTNWFSRFVRNSNTSTRILWWLFILTVLSGVVASVHWIASAYIHSTVGGVHGKIGFLMALAAIVHVGRHRRKCAGAWR